MLAVTAKADVSVGSASQAPLLQSLNTSSQITTQRNQRSLVVIFSCLFFPSKIKTVKDNLSVNALSQYSVQKILCNIKHNLEKKGFHIG